MRPIAASVLAAFVSVAAVGASVPAFAQAGPSTPEVLPPAGGEPGGASAPAEPKKPAAPIGGYAYSDKTAAKAGAPHRHAKYRKTGPVVNMPGFEQTGDGGSRLFVQLSQNVPVEERKAKGSITYVLKGASPRVSNNTNALVTVHFNTPVSKARLVPKGKDLLFVIDLRAAATPTWKINEGADKTSVLSIDFPKGDFLPAGAEGKDADGAASDGEDEGEPAPKSPKPETAAPPKPGTTPPPAAPAAPPAPKP